MNLTKLNVTANGSGWRQLYTRRELDLVTHTSLKSLLDPTHSGYVTLSPGGKVYRLEDVRNPGNYWAPRTDSEGALDNLTTGPDGVTMLNFGVGFFNEWKAPTAIVEAAADFTIFGCFLLNAGSGQNAYPLGFRDVTDPLMMGVSTDYKPRVYPRYGTGTSLASSTADFVEARLSLAVVEYTHSANRVKLIVDGTTRINTTSGQSLLMTDFRLIAGAGGTTGHDPTGVLTGKLAFVGGMAGVDSTFEPLIRAFAKERFPTGLSHAPAP